MCIIHYQILICITNWKPCPLSLLSIRYKKTSFWPLGKWGVVCYNGYAIRPNGHKLLVTENETIIWFNDSPFIHKLSIFYISIRNHQDYKSLQQGSGEMALFLHYWAIIHEISWPLNLRYLWTWNKNNLHQNTK